MCVPVGELNLMTPLFRLKTHTGWARNIDSANMMPTASRSIRSIRTKGLYPFALMYKLSFEPN